MLRFRIIGALFATIIFWASAFVGIRISLISYSPGPLALFRFIIASFFMAFLYVLNPISKSIPFKLKLQMSILGILGIGVYHLCLNYGEVHVSAGEASFIIGLMPVFIIILSILFLKERPSKLVYFGITLSLIGLILMSHVDSEYQAIHWGLFIIFISAVAGSLYTVIQKNF